MEAFLTGPTSIKIGGTIQIVPNNGINTVQVGKLNSCIYIIFTYRVSPNHNN